MAGAGYKLFNTGDVLTAAQVNTYLNEQTVMVFADSAARTTALSGVLAEGMMSYLQDTDSVEVYDGTSWTAVGGGGLSSPLTTKGDVWGYSTTDARIPVGANGTVLTADSAETLGLKWAAPAAGGGKVLQVVSGTTNTTNSTNTSTFADTGLSASITPTLATSKVLVMVSQGHYFNKNSAQAASGLRIMRDATQIWTTASYGWHNISVGAANTDGRNFGSVIYLDSPATTSAITYKTQGNTFNTTTVTWQESGYSMITLMEIGV